MRLCHVRSGSPVDQLSAASDMVICCYASPLDHFSARANPANATAMLIASLRSTMFVPASSLSRDHTQ